MNRIQQKILSTALLAFAATPVLADDKASDSYLTGDWGGRREALEQKGVEFFGFYNAIIASNVSGGLSQGSGAAGDLFVGVKVDLDKTLNREGWTFVLSGIDRHGDSIDDDVGGIYSVMQLVGGQTYFLYNMSLEKTWANNKYAFKFGRITATDDFAGSPFYGYYLSNSINGQIRAVLLDGVMTSYPFAVWGTRFLYAPGDDFRIRVGAYQLTEQMFDPDEHGTDFAFHASDGLSVMVQLEWDWSRDGRIGHFNVGINNVHFDMPNFNSDEVTDVFNRYYAQYDQQVTRESPGSGEGLYLFATLAYSAQQEAALVPLHSSFGAQYVGLFSGRDRDRLIFGTTYGKLSEDYADEQEALGNGRPEYEWIFELGYRVQLSNYAYFQPDVQYIKQPGGTGDIPNATVLGMQFGVIF
jgi:porin